MWKDLKYSFSLSIQHHHSPPAPPPAANIISYNSVRPGRGVERNKKNPARNVSKLFISNICRQIKTRRSGCK